MERSREKRKIILSKNHDIPTSGHLGTFKTLHRIAEKYYWPKMKVDVLRYVRQCNTCAKSKPEQKITPGRMGGHSRISQPWETICIDKISPLPRSSQGFMYILVVADCFSKYPLCFPLRTATATNICRHLENDIFLVYGVPRIIISDNGVQFRSRVYKKFLDSYKIKPSFTAVYHPQANPTERITKSILIAFVSDNYREWSNYLSKVACAIRTAKHETTGFTPYFINFGRDMVLEGNANELNQDIKSNENNDTLDHSSNNEDNTETEHSVDENDRNSIISERTINRDKILDRACEFKKLYKNIQKRLENAYKSSKHKYDLRHREINFQPNQLVWRKNFVQMQVNKLRRNCQISL